MKLNPAWVTVAALAGALSVALGAIGSHAAPDMRAAAHLATAAQYGLAHAVALVASVALAPRLEGASARLLAVAAWLFTAGLVLFSGGLATVALTGFQPVGRIVPFGGTSYILGWLALGAAAAMAIRRKER